MAQDAASVDGSKVTSLRLDDNDRVLVEWLTKYKGLKIGSLISLALRELARRELVSMPGNYRDKIEAILFPSP